MHAMKTTSSQPLIPVLAVVGVGLIGGSFISALRHAGQVGHVIGVGRNAQTLARAQALGLIDEAASPEDAAARADLILLATPVGALPAVFAAIAPHLRPGTVVTDAGSTKQDVIAAAYKGLGARIDQFVPAHPIAGSDRQGPEAADAALYRGRTVILAPLAESRPADVELVRSVWRHCGAAVVQLTAETHDAVFASVSHLPHLLAFAYMNQVAAAPDAATRLALAGSGFRDFTRIAGSSPEMWRDIFISNRPALLAELEQVQAMLDTYRDALLTDDVARLEGLLGNASDTRRTWLPVAPTDFLDL
ncbi:prephenate dehydrogenase/arogenate dehydrogenase family protein [Pigmentiphaga aceris]|uniref:Prephenate dehydrogenase/arogenate dehydrogenase family protein n=1 Tax=Pigmentiphaga aceris TaxID=1940612 RepID=A0A5C0AYG5_9BURK|nr:prephenate dehydrogenase/arogenate dehydrogenase family protein [Pigmentiphaga aceris]QEI05447.1 prephenate dehydrogenase/arogenate dehydrogenase family protein [Pigmentiphaga aceris]